MHSLRLFRLQARWLPALFLFVTATASAQQGHVPAASIPRLTGAIQVDGQLDEPAWQDALQQDVNIEVSPSDNTVAPVVTKAWIAHDDDAIYLAFDARDPRPQEIRAHLRDRDGAFDDDWVGIFVDTFNDQRRAYEFFVNPLGIQQDLIRNENAGGNEDDSWNGLWTSAGRRTDTGYLVEMRIPYSTLRFRGGSEDKTWGILLYRNYPRSVRHQIASTRIPRGNSCLTCQFPVYTGMADVKQGRNLLVMPSLTVTDAKRRSAPDTHWHGQGMRIEPGLDVSWGPHPSTTLNLTLNPDFSQVESDSVQLNLNNSFALYFAEKRPFFLEGADYFTTPFEVLYTRQIANPDAGVRLTGRTDNAAYGVIAARDAVTTLLVPGTLGSGVQMLEQPANVLVGRFRQNLGKHLTVGTIVTARQGQDYRNIVGGLDSRWQQGGHTINLQALRSTSAYPTHIAQGYASDLGANSTPSGNALRGYYGFANKHWTANVSHMQIDPGFRADLGFIGQVGYRKSVIGGGYKWFRDGKAINRINLYSDWDITYRYDGQLLERELEFQLNVNGPRQSTLYLNPVTRVRYWNGRMFNESQLYGQLSGRPHPDVQVALNGRFGTQTDLSATRLGHIRALGTWGNADIGLGHAVGWEGGWQSLTRDGGEAYSARFLDLRYSWQATQRQRIRIALQGTDVRRDGALYAKAVQAHSRGVGGQLVYSYKVNPFTAFYAGATLGGRLDDTNPSLFATDRGMFFKLSYGWQP